MFDNFCSLFSTIPQSGQYAYETFKKVPQLKVLIQAVNMVSKMKKGDLKNNMGTISNLINTQSNVFGFNPSQMIPSNLQQLTNHPNILSQFIHTIPQQSIKATEQNLQILLQSNQDKVIKQIKKSNYSQLIKKHQQSGEKFTDPDFPPNQQSIGKVQDVTVNASWKRISQIIKNPQFISDKIQPNDILQGSIGDCYFLSAISALAQFDFRIKNLFIDLNVNTYGIYMARILYQGVLRQVVVDDYVPVTHQGIPLFAKPAGGKQIWVMILEKCWAKLHGSYGAIVGGLPNEVLHAFSGAPTFYRPIHQTNKEKQQALWHEVFDAHFKGAILCCGTKGQPSVQKAGLVVGHAYTIIDVYDSPYRLLKIRNPWGKRQWNGRASDQDTYFWSTISPQQKLRINYTKGNEGVFFMLWQDFVNYFDMIDICKVKDNANFINIDCQFNKKRGQIFEFYTDGGDLTINLSQQSLRGKSDAQQKKGYARSTIVVAKYDQQRKGFQYKYVDSSSCKLFSQHALQFKSLHAGEYVAFVKFDWIRKPIQTATISLYTESTVTLEKSSQSDHKQFLFKTFLDHARQNPKKKIISQQPKQWICSEFLLNKSGYGYLAIHLDERSTKRLGVEINEKDFTQRRLVLKKPYKGQGVIKTVVEPGKQFIIVFRMKAHNYPSTITLPAPKIFNLV